MFKRLLRHPATLTAAARLIGLYLAFVYATTRWTFLGRDDMAVAVASGRPLMVSFWHERLPMMPMLVMTRPLTPSPLALRIARSRGTVRPVRAGLTKKDEAAGASR